MSCPRNRFGSCTKPAKPDTEEVTTMTNRLLNLVAARQAQDAAFSAPQAQAQDPAANKPSEPTKTK
jgi:hypothetical protein